MRPLAIISSHPIQYQTPLYRYLASSGFPLHVYFLDDQGLVPSHDPGFGINVAWDISLLDGYPHTFLPNHGLREKKESFWGLVNPGIVTAIRTNRSSAVLIHGWRSASMMLALLAARMCRVPVLYRSDTSEPPDMKARIAGRLLRLGVSACLPVGTLNRQFYLDVGVPETRLFNAPHAVDNDRLQAASEHLSKREARAALGIQTNDTIILFVGKLVSWKQPDMLLEAVSRLARTDVRLVFVGEGQMRKELETASAAAGVPVHFLGFLNQTMLPTAYRAADLLALPSRHEPWGLVVNEAMNFAIPTVVSDAVGCAPDLVRPGITGEVFDHRSVISLVDALRRLLADPNNLRRQGDAARDHISHWGFRECADGIRLALEAVGGTT